MKVVVQSVCAQWGCTETRDIRLWCSVHYQQWKRAESIYQCYDCGHTYTGNKRKCDAFLVIYCGEEDCRGHQQNMYGCMKCGENYYSFQQSCGVLHKIQRDKAGAFETEPCGGHVAIVERLTCNGICRKIGSHLEHWTVHDAVEVIRRPERMPDCDEPDCKRRSVPGRNGKCYRCYDRHRRRSPDVKAKQEEYRQKWANKPENKLKVERYRESQAYKDAQAKSSLKYRSNPKNKRHQRLRDRARYLHRKYGTTKQSVILT